MKTILHPDDATRAAARLMNLTPAKRLRAIEKYDNASRLQIGTAATYVAIAAAQVAALAENAAHGADTEPAVRRITKQIRRVFGFTYP